MIYILNSKKEPKQVYCGSYPSNKSFILDIRMLNDYVKKIEKCKVFIVVFCFFFFISCNSQVRQKDSSEDRMDNITLKQMDTIRIEYNLEIGRILDSIFNSATLKFNSDTINGLSYFMDNAHEFWPKLEKVILDYSNYLLIYKNENVYLYDSQNFDFFKETIIVAEREKFVCTILKENNAILAYKLKLPFNLITSNRVKMMVNSSVNDRVDINFVHGSIYANFDIYIKDKKNIFIEFITSDPANVNKSKNHNYSFECTQIK